MQKLPTLKIKEENPDEVIEIDESRLIAVPYVDVQHNGTPILYSHTNARFGGNAYALSKDYEWVIGIDEQGTQILVPLEKESK